MSEPRDSGSGLSVFALEQDSICEMEAAPGADQLLSVGSKLLGFTIKPKCWGLPPLSMIEPLLPKLQYVHSDLPFHRGFYGHSFPRQTLQQGICCFRECLVAAVWGRTKWIFSLGVACDLGVTQTTSTLISCPRQLNFKFVEPGLFFD